jgi:hypothetical protein
MHETDRLLWRIQLPQVPVITQGVSVWKPHRGFIVSRWQRFAHKRILDLARLISSPLSSTTVSAQLLCSSKQSGTHERKVTTRPILPFGVTLLREIIESTILLMLLMFEKRHMPNI